MNKKIIFFTIVLVMCMVAIYGYFNVPAIQLKMIAVMDKDFSQENTYSDLKSISRRLDEEVLKGSESFVIFLKDMNVNELYQVNEAGNGIFGRGTTYESRGTVAKGYQKVEIFLERTTNYYVYDAYVNGNRIPDDERKAEDLYEVVCDILGQEISSGMSDYEKELALHDYLVSHCRYSENTNQAPESDIYRAYGALVNHDAVCNGYAEAMQLLFTCLGMHTQFVIGTADGIDHAWNMIELNGEWYHVDTTWDDPLPDEGENVVHAYFNVTDDVMLEHHKWEQEEYPKAEGEIYNFYTYNQLYFDDFDSYKNAAYHEMIDNGIERYEAAIRGYEESEDDMQFVFDSNDRYNSVNWKTFKNQAYCVLVLNAK